MSNDIFYGLFIFTCLALLFLKQSGYRNVSIVMESTEGKVVLSQPTLSRRRAGCGLILVLLIVIIILIPFFYVMSGEGGMDLPNGESMIGKIKAVAHDDEMNGIKSMWVDFWRVDPKTHALGQHESFILPGDLWYVRANVRVYQQWTYLLGLKSSFKLVGITSSYSDNGTHQQTPIQSIGGNLPIPSWLEKPFVRYTQTEGVGEPDDGVTYDLFAEMPTASLMAVPER